MRILDQVSVRKDEEDEPGVVGFTISMSGCAFWFIIFLVSILVSIGIVGLLSYISSLIG